MSRNVGSAGRKTIEAIREAGLRLIYEHGYEGMGLRQLASAAGIGQSSLYNHFGTKQELLLDLIRIHMDDLFENLEKALGDGGTGFERLVRFVRFHVHYHVRRKREVFICYSELRSLEPGNFREVAEMRRAYERRLIEILDQGVAEGTFRPIDTKIAAYGILSMLSGICIWFRQDGRLTDEEVCAVYMNMVLGAVTDPAGLAAAHAGYGNGQVATGGEAGQVRAPG